MKRTCAAITVLLTGLAASAMGQNVSPPSVSKAADGIFSAFATHPIVGVGDFHGMAQEEDFYGSLIRDPRFAKDVGNVVVEFGDASQQGTIDRYVNGEDLPYSDLRKVWADTVGWFPAVTSLGYINFFAQVRAANSTLPEHQRIHVWLGDPPVDWLKATAADVSKSLADRDNYPAGLLESQILAKHKRALVIYGTFHFYYQDSLKQQIDVRHPGAFFVVTPYSGFIEKTCSETFEGTTQKWPVPALASPVRASELQAHMQVPGCHFLNAADFSFPPDFTQERKARELAEMEDQSSGVGGDALLYLGPASSLTQSPHSPDLYLDAAFRKELSRRSVLKGAGPLTWPTVWDNPSSPQFVRAYGNSRSTAP